MARLEPGRAIPGGRTQAPWIRVARLFVPEALQQDPEEHRRARTAVYLCAIPVVTSLGYAWHYSRVLAGDTAVLVGGIILGVNLACADRALTLRWTGRVAFSINLLPVLLRRVRAPLVIFGGVSSFSTKLALFPGSLLTSGTRPALIWLSLCLASTLRVLAAAARLPSPTICRARRRSRCG
jgi:hypothetical protein